MIPVRFTSLIFSWLKYVGTRGDCLRSLTLRSQRLPLSSFLCATGKWHCVYGLHIPVLARSNSDGHDMTTIPMENEQSCDSLRANHHAKYIVIYPMQLLCACPLSGPFMKNILEVIWGECTKDHPIEIVGKSSGLNRTACSLPREKCVG